ncbi:MAG TPA: hypothetical protein VNL92_02250, partial [Dehalococcoidia bacterium]|nr:hypothetical protein [Dehalococcoidia bacterium]
SPGGSTRSYARIDLFLAFCVGLFVMGLASLDLTFPGYVLFAVGLAGTAYALSRLTVRWLTARRER